MFKKTRLSKQLWNGIVVNVKLRQSVERSVIEILPQPDRVAYLYFLDFIRCLFDV